jgi:hypothetical protein
MPGRRTVRPNGIHRLERIAALELPALVAPPANPTVEQAMSAWMAMAQAYGSIVMRQQEFETATIEVLRHMDRAIESLTAAVDLRVEDPAEDAEGDPPTAPRG